MATEAEATSSSSSPAKKAKLSGGAGAGGTATRVASLKSLLYTPAATAGNGPTLAVLDQLLIPEQKVYVDITSTQDAWNVIRSMQIRGAPLIAIVAALGLAVDVSTNPDTMAELAKIDEADVEATATLIQTRMEHLKTSRPTAVNLFNAMDELEGILQKAKTASSDSDNSTSDPPSKTKLVKAVVEYAEFMLERDVRDNESIGKFGAEAILSTLTTDGTGRTPTRTHARVVTICNTGSLATAHFGTALGVVRELAYLEKLESITALETRPYNQGSRLTAFEIVEENFPGGQLVCDSMAAYLMKVKGVDAVVVGADRVCANGDTANKIGTYSLSIIAKEHGVPFFVAAPFTTLDVHLSDGSFIDIEERPAKELLESSRAPLNIAVWNPAFDVTPAAYITGGIVTEKGVITERTADGSLDVTAFVKKHTST
jgi:S-methyl-5-thioribose-1-phosphate isomerase